MLLRLLPSAALATLIALPGTRHTDLRAVYPQADGLAARLARLGVTCHRG